MIEWRNRTASLSDSGSKTQPRSPLYDDIASVMNFLLYGRGGTVKLAAYLLNLYARLHQQRFSVIPFFTNYLLGLTQSETGAHMRESSRRKS